MAVGRAVPCAWRPTPGSSALGSAPSASSGPWSCGPAPRTGVHRECPPCCLEKPAVEGDLRCDRCLKLSLVPLRGVGGNSPRRLPPPGSLPLGACSLALGLAPRPCRRPLVLCCVRRLPWRGLESVGCFLGGAVPWRACLPRIPRALVCVCLYSVSGSFSMSSRALPDQCPLENKRLRVSNRRKFVRRSSGDVSGGFVPSTLRLAGRFSDWHSAYSYPCGSAYGRGVGD